MIDPEILTLINDGGMVIIMTVFTLTILKYARDLQVAHRDEISEVTERHFKEIKEIQREHRQDINRITSEFSSALFEVKESLQRLTIQVVELAGDVREVRQSQVDARVLTDKYEVRATNKS